MNKKNKIFVGVHKTSLIPIKSYHIKFQPQPEYCINNRIVISYIKGFEMPSPCFSMELNPLKGYTRLEYRFYFIQTCNINVVFYIENIF